MSVPEVVLAPPRESFPPVQQGDILSLLRPYQVIGCKWLYQGKRKMLADDVGVGKTRQAILAAIPPVLVACPAYLLDGWKSEIHALLPDATIAIAQGVRSARIAALGEGADWTLINTEMLRDHSFPRDYNTFIADESHHLRGHAHDNKQVHGALRLARRTPRVYLLTATPIYNEVDDVFAQFRLLDPMRFSNYDRFLSEWCRWFDNGYRVVVKGAKDKVRFGELCAEYMLGRKAKDVGLQLPEEVSQDIVITQDKAWLKAYNTLRLKYRVIEEGEAYESAGEVLAELRAITAAVKAHKCKDIAQDRRACLWYTWYRSSAEMVAEALTSLTPNKPVVAITGEMPAAKRAAIAQGAANAGTHTVATIKSLSEGINFLAKYDTIVFVEEDYVPGSRKQAIGRVKRWIANDERAHVNILTLLVKGTVDVAVNKAVDRRETTASAVLARALHEEAAE